MTPSADSSPHRTYTERRAAAQAKLAELDRVSARYANLRGLTFLAAAAIAGLTAFGRLPKSYWWAVAGAIAVYAHRSPCCTTTCSAARLGRGCTSP